MSAARSGRRGALAALGLTCAGLSAVAAATAVAPGEDAELIALCSTAAALAAEYEAILDSLLDIPGDDPQFAAGHAAAERIGLNARDIRRLVLARCAHSVAGMRAKAEAVRSLIDAESGDPVELFAWSLARDLGAMERGV